MFSGQLQLPFFSTLFIFLTVQPVQPLSISTPAPGFFRSHPVDHPSDRFEVFSGQKQLLLCFPVWAYYYILYMELSQGFVKSVTFRNELTGFSVVKIFFKGDIATTTCTGILPLLSEGETVSVKGNWEYHKKFGRQFAVQSYTLQRPTTPEGIFAFLTSGLLPNIGPVRAKQIVDLFGLETLDIIDQHPEKLLKIQGLGKKSVQKITGQWKQNDTLRKLVLFLQEYDVSLTTTQKIFRKYGPSAQEIISQNPYSLYEDISGIGFIKADLIAQKMGFAPDSYQRIRAGLIYIMNNAASEGHCCLPLEEGIQRAAEILSVSEDLVRYSLDHTINVGLLIKENEWIYLPYLFHAEKNVSEKISCHITYSFKSNWNISTIAEWLTEYQKNWKWRFDTSQRQAIIETVTRPVMLLTGGPGTGKTTVIRGIVQFFKDHNKKVVLAAPTGRAAQRIQEVSGCSAKTIHRLLEYNPGHTNHQSPFNRNENNPVDTDVIIIDELSMIDIQLMNHLCSALNRKTQLLLVGDSNQLPSVGAGNVLSDLISSGIAPHIQLSTVFRQAANSRIVTAAHEINHGITPVFSNKNDQNCFFLEQSDPNRVVDLIMELSLKRLPLSYGLDPVKDIQVLSPLHRGVLGTENINSMFQSTLHTDAENISLGQTRFHAGEKVMQIKNNYEKNVFNGDIGIISEIVGTTGCIVTFQGTSVPYEKDELEELIPAYCITIHKSQGSEFNAVIIPLVTQHYIMLQRNLIYTAITRAKRICILVGSKRALNLAVKNNTSLIRFSRLKNRLIQCHQTPERLHSHGEQITC